MDRFGWRPAIVGRLLVLPDSTAARQRVAALDNVLRIALQIAAGRSGTGYESRLGPWLGSFFNGISPPAILSLTGAESDGFAAPATAIPGRNIAEDDTANKCDPRRGGRSLDVGLVGT